MIFMTISNMFRQSDESGAGAIVNIIVQLLMRLTSGTIFGTIDFLVRLPFWLVEYSTFDSNAEVKDRLLTLGQSGQIQPAIGSGTDAEAKRRQAIFQQAQQESVSSLAFNPMQFLYKFSFYLVSAMAAVMGSIVQILLIWAPIPMVLMCLYKVRT
jgi:hypothetical protein